MQYIIRQEKSSCVYQLEFNFRHKLHRLETLFEKESFLSLVIKITKLRKCKKSSWKES